MSKPYYADYVNHSLRFYFRYDSCNGFKNDVDKMNYIAVDRVVKKLNESDKIILEQIYCSKNPNLHETVSEISEKLHLDEKGLWALLSSVTNKIAKERRLL